MSTTRRRIRKGIRPSCITVSNHSSRFMLSNTSYNLILSTLGLTTTFFHGTCNQMEGKPDNGSEIRRGMMKTVMKPSRQSRHHHTHSVSEPLPPNLQKLVNKEEQDRMVYEDTWTRTYVYFLDKSLLSGYLTWVYPRRPSDKFEMKPFDHHTTEELSEPLPRELQRLVDKEEADRLRYEDPWTKTYVKTPPQNGFC
jgi:hypothetical protein